MTWWAWLLVWGSFNAGFVAGGLWSTRRVRVVVREHCDTVARLHGVRL
ncbi:hypothetical protein [Salinarimonas soli]|nr:hypothetical protein [Salinarimonas soli]